MKRKKPKIIIYIRYAAPIVLSLALLLLALVPCYFYVLDGQSQSKASLLWLCSSHLSGAREALFGTTAVEPAEAAFYKLLFALIICLFALFAIGAASTVYALVRFIRFSRGDRASTAHAVFLTLAPNRVVLSVYHSLMLPLLFLPHLLPLIYRQILSLEVERYSAPFDILIISLALYIATLALIAVSARAERLAELNIYTRVSAPSAAHECDGEDTDSGNSHPQDDPSDPYEEIIARAKQEQAARILGLLNNQDKEDNK